MKPSKRLVGFVSILLVVCMLPLVSGCGLIVYTEEAAGKTTASGSHGAMTTAPVYTTGAVPPEAQLKDPELKEDAKKRLDDLFYLDMSGSTLLITVADETVNTLDPGEDSILSAVYKERNSMITEKFGCDFYMMSSPVEQMMTDLKASINSGKTSSYNSDLLFIPASYAGIFAAAGLVLDLKSLPFYTVATEGNKGAGDYNGKNFFDISAAAESPEVVYALYFNRDMVEDEGAKELYDAAREGNLSFEFLLAFSERVAIPSGGYTLTVGGERDDSSFLGDIAAIRSGIDFVSGKSSGYPQVSYSSAALETMDSLFELLRDASIYLPASAKEDAESTSLTVGGVDTDAASDGNITPAMTGAELFASGKSLFHMGMLSEMSKLYNNKMAWGILPLPSLGDGTYAVATQDTGVFCVSANNSRPDVMGALLPAFDAASGEWIDAEYIAYCAENYIRDNDSFHMLKKILGEEIYSDFSYLHYGNCANLKEATFGAFRNALLSGTTPSEDINAIVGDLNKALKKIKY
jgi:hypothetical protein